MGPKLLCTLVCVTLLQLVTSHIALAASKIKYGEWVIDRTVEGLPIGVQKQKERICLTRDHLVPGEKHSHGCKIDWHIKQNVVDWNVSCTNGANGKGRAVYDGDKMTGRSEMVMPSAHLHLVSKVVGKWIAATCHKR